MEIQDIIDKVDIVEYIQQFIDLKKQSNGEYVALCPFHTEKTPSFTITPRTQLFYCFGCGAGGNVLNFIQKYNKCSYGDAIIILKQYANITEDCIDLRLSATKIIKKYRKLPNIKTCIKHSFLPVDEMDKYENDKSKLKIWADEGISYEVMEKYQVRYDPVNNRIVFPVRDNDGNIISVKGRTLHPDWKEKKLRKYTYYNQIGDVDFIFGFYEHKDYILQSKEIILFEGEKSVMLMESWGFYNTGAILTSHLNDFILQTLIKLGVRAVFALDKDVDIKADKNIKKLSHFVKVEYIYDKNNLLEPKMSPVDLGKDIWLQLYEGRRSLN